MAVSKRVRITDVAARAGVGVGTVSRVLNGSPQVRESTRARVLEAIEQTRYRPSRLAAGLSRGSPGVPVVVVLFGSQFTVPYGTLFTASVVAVVPIAILVLMFRRSVVSGLTAGAVKG